MSEKKKIHLGLIPRIIIAIILGIIVGKYLPAGLIRVAVTFSSIFGNFLSFVIPLMIIAFVTKGIADLGEGAGKLLLITVAIAYISTFIAGSLSYLMAHSVYPHFLTDDMAKNIQSAQGNELATYFEVPITPFFDVTGAIVFAFMLGLAISWMRTKGKGEYIYGVISEFNEIITKVLSVAIVPLLPLFIFGNFANMSYSGSVFAVLSVFWRIFICIIALHLIYVTIMFLISASYTKKNPVELIKNQVRGYMTAVGTQSSAATIPVNIECAQKDGVSKGIREFVVPLCATVHMPGSMITITSCAYTVLLMYGLPHGYGIIAPFILTLGVAMVAAPGAPGGAIMSALPFLPMIGIGTESSMATLMISLYLTQDSFGTAANVSGDNAISVAMDKIYSKYILKK